MKKKFIIIILIIVIIVLGYFVATLKKENRTAPVSVSEKILTENKDQLVEACSSRGMTFYKVSDTGRSEGYEYYYDQNGKLLATFGGFSGGGMGNNSPEFNGDDFNNCKKISK